MINHRITKGMTATFSKKTTTSDGYTAYNTGALDYLVSTPFIINMMIDASTGMLDKLLPQDYITVGKKIELLHEHPSLVGETITLKLEVENVEGHLITLNFRAVDSKGEVCCGKYQRTIISRSKLLDIAYKRSPELI
jgi:predicted thioesterase